MKIDKAIIAMINNRDSRRRIAASLGCGEQIVMIHIKENRDNGRLTKMDALYAISKETGKNVFQIIDEGVTKVQ